MGTNPDNQTEGKVLVAIECSSCGFRNPATAEFCENPSGCKQFLGYDGKRVQLRQGGVTLSVEPLAPAVDPGRETTCEVTVRNRSSIVDHYSIDVLGPAAAWSLVAPQTISLFPDDRGTSALRFRPLRSPSVLAGRTPFTVRIQSQATGKVVAVQDGVLEVGSFFDGEATMVPHSSQGEAFAKYRITIRNLGNVQTVARLSARDPDDALDFALNELSATVAPGASAVVELLVKPRVALPRKAPPRPHPFQVHVETDGSDDIVVDGVMVQEPPAPNRSWRIPWLTPIAAIVAAAVITTAAIQTGAIAGMLPHQSPPVSPTSLPQAPVAATSIKPPALHPYTPVKVIVPDVTCMSSQSATIQMYNKGLTVALLTVFNTDPQFKVLWTDPVGGTQVDAGTRVTLYVSNGIKPPPGTPIAVPPPCGRR